MTKILNHRKTSGTRRISIVPLWRGGGWWRRRLRGGDGTGTQDRRDSSDVPDTTPRRPTHPTRYISARVTSAGRTSSGFIVQQPIGTHRHRHHTYSTPPSPVVAVVVEVSRVVYGKRATSFVFFFSRAHRNFFYFFLFYSLRVLRLDRVGRWPRSVCKGFKFWVF